MPRTFFPIGLFAIALATLSGCGSTTYPSVTGTWTFSAISSVVPSEPPQHLTGTLTSQGSNVTGTLTFTNACFKSQALAYTGSFTDSTTLKLTSAVYANQQITLNGTISSDGSFLTAGNYSVAAQNSTPTICDQGDTGALTGSRSATQ